MFNRSTNLKVGVLALAGALTMASGAVFAAPKLCDDGTRPPCDSGGGAGSPPVDFGDLFILYRDPNGVPYLTANLCVQPLPSASCDNACGLVDGEIDGDVPAEPVAVIPVDANCAVYPECATCTQEVDFGRINEARSPDEVFETQLDDVVVALATADCVTLDPAGRMVATSVDDTTLDNLAKTIDSPLQNLAVYRELMLNGYIGTAPGIPLPGDNIYDTAARGLGAASDKAGEVNVDMVAYLNEIMGLTSRPTVLGKICITVREEVQGVVQPVEKCFLNYGNYITTPLGADYQYTREDNFEALPDPAYIPEGAAMDGWFEYLAVDPLASPVSFKIDQGPITNAVFCYDELGEALDPVFDATCTDLDGTVGEGYEDGNIGGFAQAADDARATIAFMHAWQVPVGYETSLECTPSGVVSYDLAISDVSGLQVPKNYVNNQEREFTVSVGNNGPDPANYTVTVTAAEQDNDVLGSWTWSYVGAPVGTKSETVLFTFNTTSPVINWNATVEADAPGTDPNLDNNSQDETSTVKASGGGGGGRP